MHSLSLFLVCKRTKYSTMKKISINITLFLTLISQAELKASLPFDTLIENYQLTCLAIPIINLMGHLSLFDAHKNLETKKGYIRRDPEIHEKVKIIKLARVEHVITALSSLEGLEHPNSYEDNIPTALTVTSRVMITGLLSTTGVCAYDPLKLSLHSINAITSLPTMIHTMQMLYAYHKAKSERRTIHAYTIEDVLTQDLNELFAKKMNKQQYNPQSKCRQYLQDWRNLHPEQYANRISSAPTKSYSEKKLKEMLSSHILSGDILDTIVTFLKPNKDCLVAYDPDLKDHIGELDQKFYTQYPRSTNAQSCQEEILPISLTATDQTLTIAHQKNLTDYINSYRAKNKRFPLTIKVLDDAQYVNQDGIKIEKLSKEQSNIIRAGFKKSVEKYIEMKKNGTSLEIVF